MRLATKTPLVLAVMVFSTVACQTLSEEEPVAALLHSNNAEVQAQIKAVVEAALNTEELVLGDNVFVAENRLMVERAHKQSLSGQLSKGAVLDDPDSFVLQKDRKGCLIRHLNQQRTWRLVNANCVRLDSVEKTE